MGSRRVTDSNSLLPADGKSKDLLSADFRYGDKFKELCSYYMSIGMSYDDYWNGDCELVTYYRDAEKKRINRQNFNMWLQGRYIYEAICDSAPIMNPLSTSHEPLPYRESPIPLTDTERKDEEKERARRKMENDREIMKQIMIAINERFKEKERSDG